MNSNPENSRQRRGIFCQGAFLLAICLLTIAPTPCNLRIEGIPGSSEKQGREGSCDIFAVDHELVQSFDSATGAASGPRQHRPLTVLKVIDRATPGLHNALVNGQNIKNVVLDFYRIDPATREETKYYAITLKGVRIVGIKTMMPTSFLPENESYRHMEEVRMIYESIEWHWLPDAIEAQDDWRMSPAALKPPSGSTDLSATPRVSAPALRIAEVRPELLATKK